MKKNAVSPWISYVLLIAFVVALGAFVYNWLTDYSVRSVADVKERVFNSELCDLSGVSVEACLNSSTSQDLYINVTNRGDLRIDKLIFRFLKTSGSSVEDIYVFELDSVIKPQFTKSFKAVDLNLTMDVDSNTTIEVVPGKVQENILVICDDKKGEAYFRNC